TSTRVTPEIAAVLRATQGAQPPDHDGAAIEHPLVPPERRRARQEPDLVTHVVVETRPRLGLPGPEGLGAVLDHGAAELQPEPVAQQAGGVLGVVAPDEVVGERQAVL